MSTESFAEFTRSINTDEALRTAMTERFGTGQNIPADDFIAFAGEHGYEFSVEEASDQLSDAALEGVAGGIGIGELDTRTFEEYKITYVKIDTTLNSFNLFAKY